MAKQENRVELKGSVRTLPNGAREVGPADPHQQIEVSVYLRRGSERAEFPSAEEIGSQLPRERRHLSREDFATAHGARAADIEKVRGFALRYGLRVMGEDRARRSLRLRGSVQAFNDVFGVKLSRCEHQSETYRARTGPISIPSDLDGIIEGVFGLDNRPQAKPHFRMRKARPRPVAVSYTPLQVAQAYNFPSGGDGSGQCIGIVELGGGYTVEGLNSFFRSLGISMPKVTAISVDGGKNTPTGDPNGPDGEVELDIEVAGAIAPGAQIAVYFAPNTDQGFIDAITTAVHDTNLRPSIISISWGGPENSWTAQARDALNSACQDAAAIGVTVLAASGDNGSSDGAANGKPTVDFPAASPHVIGCGGTKLTISGNTIASGQAWNELSANEGATGGGVSEVFALPSYQQSANVPKAPNGFAGRGVPDVAGDADPETGYSVIVDGRSSVIGGTSAVAPLWAGLLARVNQLLGTSVGYLNPLLYSANVEKAMHDITSGSNGDYSARPGWDACTGLGSPDGAALVTALGGT